MKQTTLCFCIEGENVLLGMKKKGFGAGKVNGYGGKIEAGETPRAAAIRELQEESGLKVNEVDLTQGALVHFSFEEKPMFDCFVFLTKAWTGELIETAEMKPEWHAIAQLPFASMWVADIQWLPLVLAGQTIEVYVNFNTDGSVVKEFSYKAAVFE
jgi:mutator protein MutT